MIRSKKIENFPLNKISNGLIINPSGKAQKTLFANWRKLSVRVKNSASLNFCFENSLKPLLDTYLQKSKFYSKQL